MLAMGNLLKHYKSLALLLLIAAIWPESSAAQNVRPTAQREVMIFDPNISGSGTLSLRAAGGTASYTLIFPSSAPSSNNVLGISGISGGTATMTWTTPVNSFSGGSTGFTPSSSSTGAITLGGTLNVSNGGTGTTSLSGILLGNGTGAVTGTSNSSGIAGVITDETGTGALVFGTSPTVSSLTVSSGGVTISAGGLTVTTGDITVNAGGASVFGNVLINNNGAAGELRLLEPASAGTNYTALRAQAQSANITYSLPSSDGSNGQVLSTNGGGTLSWTTVTTTVPLSTLVAATSGNTINNADFTQSWQWNTLTSGSGLALSTNSTAAASNSQTLLSVSMSGANTSASQTTYGLQVSNTHTGTSSTNVGLQVSASGATNNYGLLVNSGNVGIGITTPARDLHIDKGTSTASYLQFSAGSTTAQAATDGFDIGIDATGLAILNQKENLGLRIMTNNTSRLTIAASGEATFSGSVTATSFFESSDMRLKDLVRRDGDIAYFTWKDKRDLKTHIGYLAQEVQQNFPDQVKADENGLLAVNYIEVLVAKIRLLEKKIETLENKRKRYGRK